ncbi:MAG: sigma-70 family RNA polymerase sigma factor [Phycisphaerales bacterium]
MPHTGRGTQTARSSADSNARLDAAALVERLRAGDPAAPESLLDAYAPALLAIARSILGDENAAMDAVQDAVVSALRSLDTLQDPGALGAWLKRTVTNAALVELRRRRRRRERPIEDLLPSFHADGHRVVDSAPSGLDAVEDRMDREAMLARVREAMEELPDHYREVIMLRDVMGVGTNEAAATLSITPNHVKVRLHRARMALRTLLQERLTEPAHTA